MAWFGKHSSPRRGDRVRRKPESLRSVRERLGVNLLHTGDAVGEAPRRLLQVIAMRGRTYNVLFLCTGNSVRSILAEAILNKEGAGRFCAFSAGSFPKEQVNPASLKLLGELGYSTEGYRSKSWDEFATADAPPLDFVFTVCDDAAGETCPIWPGHPVTAHWGIPDPAAAEPNKRDRAFRDAYYALQRRIGLFLCLPLESIDAMSLQSKLREIGRRNDEDAA